jgi:hypothetical protein
VSCPKEESKTVGRKFATCGICIQQGGTLDHEILSIRTVYGFKPVAPIDLLPLPMQERMNFDASKRAEFVKKLHDRARTNIEKMTKMYEKRANKGCKKMLFEP